MSTVHAFVSAIADGGDATQIRPSDWNADHVTIVSTTATATETDRLIVVSDDRLTVQGTGRQRVVTFGQAFAGAYALGDVEVMNDGYLLQYKRTTLTGTARASLFGNAELFMFDLAPVGRLVLAGRGL